MTFNEEQTNLRRQGKKALALSMGLTFAFMLAEVWGGLASRSLALLADAAHMLTDVFALSLALFAFRMGERPPTQRMSYGFHRAEILAALANGVILLNVVLFIFMEAFKRLASPPPVASSIMLCFAFLGLLVNLLCFHILKGVNVNNLNLRGALYHVISDLLGSLGVLSAGLLVRFFHLPYADPLAGIVIGGLIIFSAWRLLADSVSILLEASPSHIDLAALENSLLAVEGVKDIHDLHVWTISSGREALSAHLDVEKDTPPDEILKRVNVLLEEKFGIFHSTIQLETAGELGHSSGF